MFNTVSKFRQIVNFYCSAAISLKHLPSDGLPIVGSLFSFIMAGSSPKLHLYIDAKHKRLGPVFREVIPSRSTVFLSDPDKIRQVFSSEGKCPKHFLPEPWLLYNRIFGRKRGLLFMEKEEWQHYRKIMNQFFLKDKALEELHHVYEDIAYSLVVKWRKHAASNRYLDCLNHEMYTHSISSMLATAIGSSYKGKRHLFEKDLLKLMTYYQKIFDTTTKLMVLPADLASALNLSSWSSFVSAMDASLHGSELLLSKIKDHISDDGLIKALLEAGVSERMITVLITDLMMAAGDTTAYTLQWALYLLGRHQEVQEQARDNNDLIRGIIKETLRLYPAAPFLTRQIDRPVEVSGYQIPAHEMVIMSMYTCGRSQSNFTRPDEFQPERWLRDSNGQLNGVINKFASLPFAMGARSCVGKKLADIVMTTTIKAILSHYEVTTLQEVDMILRLTPAPSQPFKIKINYF